MAEKFDKPLSILEKSETNTAITATFGIGLNHESPACFNTHMVH